MTERRKLIEQLLKEGKTYEEIGKIMNISRQRVHQILTGYRSPFHARRYQKDLISKPKSVRPSAA